MTKKKKYIILNAIIPIVLGAIVYYLISPDVLFVKHFNSFTGTPIHFIFPSDENLLIRFLRNYFLDMLWAYALVFALFYIIGNNTASLLKSFLISFFFSIAMEILQITPFVKGTFDVFDILVEFLAEVIAVFIINKKLRG